MTQTSLQLDRATVPTPPMRRSMLQRIMGDVVHRWGARVGLAWIVLLVLGAVFAPLIANSHPLLMQVDGRWSSPLLTYLSVGDVLLLLGFVAFVAVLPWRSIASGYKALLFVTVMGVVAGAALWPGELGPFVMEGHQAWLPALEQWQAYEPGEIPGAGADVTPGELPGAGFPLGAIAWWLLRWAGLAVGAVLLAVGVVAVARAREIPLGVRTAALGLAVGVGACLVIWPIDPPTAVVYASYREGLAEGTIDRAIHVPVPYSPADRLRDLPELRLTPPSLEHPMGVTENGADLFSNMLYATRIALSIGFISTGIAIVLGVLIGGLMGYYAGLVDLLGMRFVEIFSAIPTLLLLLCFVAFFDVNLYFMMAIIGLTSWVGYALFIRAEFLKLRQQEFVEAAEALGLPLWSILFRHMLPNGVTPVLVSASFGVASAILAESTLSFLGIGLVDEASWGKLLNAARSSGGTFSWWVALFPGLAIFLTVFAYNLVGEAIRDALDPHMQQPPG